MRYIQKGGLMMGMLFVLSNFCIYASHSNEDELAYVLNGIRYHLSLLQSGQVKVEKRRHYTEYGKKWMLNTQENFRKDNISLALEQDNQDALFAFDRRKVYFELYHKGPALLILREGIPSTYSNKLFFDGEITTQVEDNLASDGTHRVWAHIWPGYRRGSFTFPYFDPRKWTDTAQYLSFGTHLGENALGIDGDITDVKFRLLDMQQVNGHDCYQLEAALSDDNKNPLFWVLFINPDKGFWPEQIEFHYVNRKTLERTLGRKAEYHLRQSLDGIWYPEGIVYRLYLNGQPAWEDRVRFLDFQINIDVSDKLRIDIPPGTPIVDHRLGEGQSKVVAP